MTEAYEVGVRLALHDGVSVGLHAARRELQAVNTAMGVSTVSLQRLQRAGGDALTGARTLALPRPRTTTPKAERAPDPPSARPEPKARPRPEAVSAPAVPKAIPRPEISVPSRPLRPPEDAAQASRVVVAPRAGVAEARYQPLAAAAPTSGGPTTPSARATNTAPVVNPRVAMVAEQGSPWANAGAPKVQEPARPDLGAGWAKASVPSLGLAAPVRVAPELRHDGGAVAQRIAGAAGTPTSPGNFSTVPPVSTGAGKPVAPQPGSAPATAPTGGDVYLDGALMGRWVSRHLEREAARPQAGPTGFDARRNPILPGAAVGGS